MNSWFNNLSIGKIKYENKNVTFILILDNTLVQQFFIQTSFFCSMNNKLLCSKEYRTIEDAEIF